jgi:hypothetical protein
MMHPHVRNQKGGMVDERIALRRDVQSHLVKDLQILCSKALFEPGEVGNLVGVSGSSGAMGFSAGSITYAHVREEPAHIGKKAVE